MFGLFKKKEENRSKLFYTTDMHLHILPGIDDGSPDVETSLELIRNLQKWGINRVIATPHITEATFENTAETIENAYRKLREAMDKEGMKMDIHYSAEYRMDENFMEIVRKGEIIPFPNNYVLIENSFLQPFYQLNDLIFQLQLKGYQPILAHPERYSYYFGNKKIYDDLHNQGCLFQVNLLSIGGYYNKAVKGMAEWLLEKGYIDFLGSDMHNKKHAAFLTEFIDSKEFKKIEEKVNIKNDLI